MRTLDEAAAKFDLPLGKKLGHYRAKGEIAVQVLAALKWKLTAPPELRNRWWTIAPSSHGNLSVEVPRKRDDTEPGDKWQPDGNVWRNISTVKADQRDPAEQLSKFDPMVRALSDISAHRAGWSIRHKSKPEWRYVGKDDARSYLIAEDYSKAEADHILGELVQKDWSLVNLPFQAEYPGDRQWNHNAAQFRLKPAEMTGPHPHWDLVFDWVGQDLTAALAELDWAKECGIRTGGDYMRAWAACLFRHPLEPLPYLFFYGEKQNSGKSMFHESLCTLMSKGFASATHAISNQNGFNGELANVVLAFVEETDISKSPGAYNKLKDWTTSPILWIRRMRTDSYAQANSLHFVQTANSPDHCPVFNEDTRIVVSYVPKLPAEREIPKSVLLEALGQEAPFFLRTLLDLTLPPVMGRMRLPVVETQSKKMSIEANVPTFISALCDYMVERKEAKLFAKDYHDVLGVSYPKTIRSAKTMLTQHERYLGERGITFHVSEQNSTHGQALTLRNALA